MASPYFDDCQKLFITPPQASSYVNPLYDEKATTDSESIKSLVERIVDFAEESKRLYEERMKRLEENLKVCKLNLPKLKTSQPKREVLMEDSKKCHAAASPGTLKQFCKSQNVTEMPIVNEGQTTLRPENNPMIILGGHKSQLQRATQSQQRHAALEATSTSMPPSHSKSAKTNTSNSPLTPERYKPTQVQTCQPSINQGLYDGRQKANAATQKPTLWPASVHKFDKVSTSSTSTSFETNEHVSSALLKKCSRRPCCLNGRSPSKFNYGQWLKVKYPFKVVSLKRGVISNLGGQPSQIEQQRLQDLIVNEVHKATTKKAARFVPLQPDANSSIQSMPSQQKHVCKLSPPQQFADSLPKATQVACRPPCCSTCRRPYSKNNDSFQSGFHQKFPNFPYSHKDNMGGGIKNIMPSHMPSRRRRKKSKDLCWTPMKEQKQQTHVSEWRHGGHDLVEKHGGMCKCYLYKQSQFRHCRHINLVACLKFPTQNPRTLRRRLQKKRAKEHRRHVAEVHASQWQQPLGKQRFIWVEKKKHSTISQEANKNSVNAIVSPKTSAKCVPFKSNDSKAAKELNQDAASSSKEAVKNKANMFAKENKMRDHKKDAATFVPRRGMLPSVKSMPPRRHSARNMRPLQTHDIFHEGTYWLQNLDGSLHLTTINGLPFQPCCPSIYKSCSRSKWK
ncbi:hypothetical protein SLEP1_g30592 [Rubroshorea leprosula]|uniref:Uncharacterized protein n=1 Tax=Rubroshorea leprosula TaxID=152421 RepID=A0AAV5K0L0_9ROSI|nr:hypothetical protein SLEP1_g30592 [Rubroshorea leprosula]